MYYVRILLGKLSTVKARKDNQFESLEDEVSFEVDGWVGLGLNRLRGCSSGMSESASVSS